MPPGDAEALADALVQAVDAPAERTRRGREASADARARFAWPALAARVADIYTAARPSTRAAA